MVTKSSFELSIFDSEPYFVKFNASFPRFTAENDGFAVHEEFKSRFCDHFSRNLCRNLKKEAVAAAELVARAGLRIDIRPVHKEMLAEAAHLLDRRVVIAIRV